MKRAGHTLLELMIAIAIFGLFLFAIFAVMNTGLKNYRLADIKGETQGQAKVALGRIVNDLIMTDMSTVITGNSGQDYIVFETAVDPNTGEFKKDLDLPLWQGYVLYYTLPDEKERKLMRKFLPLTPSTSTKKLTDIALYLTDTCNTGEELRTVARSIYELETDSSNKYMVHITLVTLKKFSERRLSYEKDFGDNTATETVKLNVSVCPRNSTQ